MAVDYVLLGVIQGLVEWLPVSSEAAVSLVAVYVAGLGPEAALRTSIYLHLGTTTAAALYFRSEVAEAVRAAPDLLSVGAWRKGRVGFLAVATVVTGVVGGAVYALGFDALSSSQDFLTMITGLALFLTGILDLYGSGGGRQVPGWRDSILVGALQGLAALPGISRSGSTVFGLLMRDFSASRAFRLSFLASIPAVLGANLGLQLIEGLPDVSVASASTGLATSFVVGYASIGVLLDVAERFPMYMVAFVLGLLALLPLLL